MAKVAREQSSSKSRSRPGSGGMPEPKAEDGGRRSPPGSGGMPEPKAEDGGRRSPPGSGGMPEPKAEDGGRRSPPGSGGMPEPKAEDGGRRSRRPLLPVPVERVPEGVLPREAAPPVPLLAHLLRVGDALDAPRPERLDRPVAVVDREAKARRFRLVLL